MSSEPRLNLCQTADATLAHTIYTHCTAEHSFARIFFFSDLSYLYYFQVFCQSRTGRKTYLPNKASYHITLKLLQTANTQTRRRQHWCLPRCLRPPYPCNHNECSSKMNAAFSAWRTRTQRGLLFGVRLCYCRNLCVLQYTWYGVEVGVFSNL